MKHLFRLMILVFALTPSFALATTQQCPPPVLHWRAAITPTEIREFLSHSKHIREWNQNVETIRALNSGELPRFWNKEILDTGFFVGLKDSWGTQFREQMPEGK